jgi:hypothetical protein
LSQSDILLTLGLLFGRDQGIVVQFPTVLVGVAGLWLARRRLPLSVVTSVAVLTAVLLLNGTFTTNPYGGGSFDGRFQWSMMPLLVAWSGWAISRWQAANRKLWPPILVVAGIWIFQAIPILVGTHDYYRNFNSWDPASISGWWPGLNSVLPQFDDPGRTFGSPSFALPFEVALGLFLVVIALRYRRRDSMKPLPSLVALSALAGALAVAILAGPTELPATALVYSGTRLAAGSGAPGIALHSTLPGTYEVDFRYTYIGTGAPATFAVWCQNIAGEHTATSHSLIHLGSRSSAISVFCSQPGFLAVSLHVPSGSTLNPKHLEVRKTATSPTPTFSSPDAISVLTNIEDR